MAGLGLGGTGAPQLMLWAEAVCGVCAQPAPRGPDLTGWSPKNAPTCLHTQDPHQLQPVQRPQGPPAASPQVGTVACRESKPWVAGGLTRAWGELSSITMCSGK